MKNKAKASPKCICHLSCVCGLLSAHKQGHGASPTCGCTCTNDKYFGVCLHVHPCKQLIFTTFHHGMKTISSLGVKLRKKLNKCAATVAVVVAECG